MAHNHNHSQGHSHNHSHAGGNGRRLAFVLALVVLYMVAEIIGGLLTNSLALLADAGHMLSDAGALALALFALWMARRPAPRERTYGNYRTEILAALANGATLIAVAVYIFIEAFRRFGAPPEVQGAAMMGVAVGGLIVNLAGLWILNAGKSESLNVRGAWLHVLTDALGSVGAIAAGALVWAFGWNWADPVASVVIGVLVIYSSWELLKETVNVLMEGAPGHLNVDEVRDAMRGVAGVRAVHDLHVWTITSGMVALSAHVVVEDGSFDQRTLRAVREALREGFGIEHSTVQLEREGFEEPETVI